MSQGTQSHVKHALGTLTPVTVKAMLAEPATLGLGVRDIVSLREMMKVEPELKPDPAIKVSLDKKMEFYRITLVADFAPGKNAKFVQAEISVKLESKGSASQVYSIAPLRVDEKQKVTKTWGVSPKVELGDVKANPGISYKSQRIRRHTPADHRILFSGRQSKVGIFDDEGGRRNYRNASGGIHGSANFNDNFQLECHSRRFSRLERTETQDCRRSCW